MVVVSAVRTSQYQILVFEEDRQFICWEQMSDSPHLVSLFWRWLLSYDTGLKCHWFENFPQQYLQSEHLQDVHKDVGCLCLSSSVALQKPRASTSEVGGEGSFSWSVRGHCFLGCRAPRSPGSPLPADAGSEWSWWQLARLQWAGRSSHSVRRSVHPRPDHSLTSAENSRVHDLGCDKRNLALTPTQPHIHARKLSTIHFSTRQTKYSK